MKLKNLLLGMSAVLAVLTACTPEEVDLGTPNISIDKNEMVFEMAGGDQTLAVSATRDWKLEADADWVTVNPASGVGSLEPQTVTVTALENTGMDRSADLAFTIGMKRVVLTVSQAGPGGSPEALILYYNDFDKVEATKTYGSGSSWPYLDQFDGWKNATGTGAANVEYTSNGMSARANSTSNSNYSDYAGSGKNNMFFGASAYFATKNIALNGATGMTLTFGTEKYSQDNGSVFQNSEFHIFLSQDGAKWVELTDYTFAGGETEGRWNIATANFSVPEGTENLSICMQVDVASSYRMDDMKLVISEGGATVDFSKGVEKDFNAGGESTTIPESKGKKTVEEFIATADENNYFELTGTVSGFNPKYCSFDLTDETGKIYVYSVLDASKSEWSSKIANGGTVTIYGKYLYYEQKSQHEVVKAYIVSYTPGESGDDPVTPPSNIVDVTVLEFNEKEVSTSDWYRLTGVVGGPINTTYGNYDLIDETGKVFVYGTSNWSEYSASFTEGDTVTIVGQRGDYNGKIEVLESYIESYTPGEGSGNEEGEDPVTPPVDGEGEYESNITWTLGTNAYDNTSSGTNAQSAVVNGVTVSNLLKIGTGSKVGDATLHIPAGTTKLGFYCVAWKGKKADVKFSVNGTEIATINPTANVGATGNAPYKELNVAESDYYEIEISATEATDVKVETLDPSNGRALFIGFKAE